MISELSMLAQGGIEKFCVEKDLQELFASAKHDPQACAWLMFLLRAAVDIDKWFPRGKWATIQVLEVALDRAANKELQGIKSQS
jgi:hypothetical protein